MELTTQTKTVAYNSAGAIIETKPGWRDFSHFQGAAILTIETGGRVIQTLRKNAQQNR